MPAMLLSQTSEYALRAMAQLATLPADQATNSRLLSSETGIPNHYLSKILRKLVAAGLLDSGRGHHGGFRLAHPPGAITFRAILAALDEECDPDRCAFGWGRCNARNPCLLHPAFNELNSLTCHWADRFTLADLLAQRRGARGRTADGRGKPAARKAPGAGQGTRRALTGTRPGLGASRAPHAPPR
ncbi:MAG: Rrf2 family transcriptional regulator [Deltaproteobacteria bacterium]|nr:Rrf2 family transcriptional regulator [Deltaproteobacteria bacterium]